VSADAVFPRGGVKTGRTIDSVDIRQGHGGIADAVLGISSTKGDVILGHRRAAQETEGGTGVKFDVSALRLQKITSLHAIFSDGAPFVEEKAKVACQMAEESDSYDFLMCF
jgi:hypothetical protein